MFLPKLSHRWSRRLTFALFLAGFFGLGLAAAHLISIAVTRFGILIQPAFLIWAAAFALMIVVAAVYARAWRGFLLRTFAANPGISLTRDVIGLEPTTRPFVCRTINGYRATFAVPLPIAERSDRPRATHRVLRGLFRHPVVSWIVYEAPRAPHLYATDRALEPRLATLMAHENMRLAGCLARGQITAQVCIAVDDPEQAEALALEHEDLKPIPWYTFAADFFAPGLFEQPGVITECHTHRIPAILENGAGRFLPLLVNEYEPGFLHRYHHRRFQDLAARLDRPIGWHSLVFAYPNHELRRIKRVAAMERAFPRNLLDREVREAIRTTPERIEALERQLRGARKPKLLKQIIWVRLCEADDAAVIARIATEHLWEHQIVARAVTPTTALSLFAGLHPGAEPHAADPGQGLGLGGTEEEVSMMLEGLAHWHGHEGAHLILEDPSGHTLPFHLFEGGNNYNLIIAGESGSGKSVLINGLCAAHLARSRFNRVFLVDYGGSFSGLVTALNGVQFTYRDRGRLRFSPFPVFAPPEEAEAFTKCYPGQDYTAYLEDQHRLRAELRKQALILIRDYLCKVRIADNAVFRELFFGFLADCAVPGHTLLKTVDLGIDAAGKRLTEPGEPIYQQAATDLRNLLLELRSVIRISPLLGEVKLDFSQTRLISFNLDGFAPEDKTVLVGLIHLLIQHLFAEPHAGQTLIVFDEVHKFLTSDGAASGLAKMLERTQRVTRKYGAALVLASQSPEDYGANPALIENANHHVIMRLKSRNLGPEWKLTDPEILEHARTGTEAAASAGFSTLHLGTTTHQGDLQAIYRYRFSPVALYAFTSKHRDQQLMDLACQLAGFPDVVTLAAELHADTDRLIPIGSAAFFKRLGPLIQDRYAPVRDHLGLLFSDLDANPFLDRYLDPNKARFQNIAENGAAMKRFLRDHYEEARHAVV